MAETILKIENVNSQLWTANKELKQLLSRGLRARPKNYFHSTAYRNRRWDGWKYFFCPKSGVFLTGLLPEVITALKKLNVAYKVEDHRSGFNWAVRNPDRNFLDPWLPPEFDSLTLHDYQPDLAEQAMKYKRGVVIAPTGAGKTFILITLMKCLPPNTPVLFLTKGASLVEQNYEEFIKWKVPNVGRWYDKYKQPNLITCATVHVDTFESLKTLLPKYRVLLVDEVHDCVSKVPDKAYKQMHRACVRIGFSATPYRYNDKKIDEEHKYTVKGHFGALLKTKTTETGFLTTKELQDRKILSGSDCIFYRFTEPNLVHETYQDAVALGIEQNFTFHNFVTKLSRSLDGRILVIVERLEQGEYLKQLMPEAHWVHGNVKLTDREPVIDALKKNENAIAIVMRQIITAGINVKIHHLINAAGGKAAHNLIQQMGRGLRTADDKDILHYHDFQFMMNKYLYEHSNWRMEVLEKEGHSVRLVEDIGILGLD